MPPEKRSLQCGQSEQNNQDGQRPEHICDINSVHLPFWTLRWNSNLSCLEVTKENARECWLLQQNLHVHKSSVWLNRCQVSLRRTLRIFRRQYLKPAQNKYLWSINTHIYKAHSSPSPTEQKLPLQSVLQHVRHIDKASTSCSVVYSLLHIARLCSLFLLFWYLSLPFFSILCLKPEACLLSLHIGNMQACLV